MYSRFVALSLVIAAAFGTGQVFEIRSGVVAGADASAIVLLPQALAGYRLERGWSHQLHGQRVVEQGVLFSPLPGLAADPVQLDFYRGTRLPHNGAGCYLVRGESLRSESLRSIRTRTGAAVFDVVVMEAENRVRLAAATECRAQGCTETAVEPTGSAPWQRWRLLTLAPADARAVVPFSVMIERDHVVSAQQADWVEAQLQQEFAVLVGQLDLEPAQHLAAVLN